LTNPQTKSSHHWFAAKQDFLIDGMTKQEFTNGGATSDRDLSEQQKTSGFLADIVIELSKPSDQVSIALVSSQGRFSVTRIAS
jgi:hypothetical protein